MYKDVWRRITAFVLVICMVAGLPDYSYIYAAQQQNMENARTGGTHTYFPQTTRKDSGKILLDGIRGTSAAEAGSIANAYVVEANTDPTKNAQKVDSVSFLLDYEEENRNKIVSADVDVNLYQYPAANTGSGNFTEQYRIAAASTQYTYSAVSTTGGWLTVAIPENTYVIPGEKLAAAVTIKNVTFGESDSVQTDTDGAQLNTVTYAVLVKQADVETFSKEGDRGWQNQLDDNACIRIDTTEVVQETPLTELGVSDSTLQIKEGDTRTVSAVFTPYYTTQKDVVWSSSDENIVTVIDKKDGTAEITAAASGTATITVSSTDAPEKTANVVVKVDRDIKNVSVSFAVPDISYTYNGTERKPEVVVKDGEQTLEKGIHYSVAYKDNVNAGTASAIVEGIANGYAGTQEITFPIQQKRLSLTSYTNEKQPYQYENGAAVEPSPEDFILKDGSKTLTIGTAGQADTDYYFVRYENNIDASANARIIFEGQGNYTGTFTCYFTIQKVINSEGIEVALSNDSFTYNGKEQKPKVTITDGLKTLTEGTDYSLRFPDDTTNAGEKIITVTGLGGYADSEGTTRNVSYNIVSKSMTSNDIAVSIPNQTEGFAENETIVGLEVTDKQGNDTYVLIEETDYTVTEVIEDKADKSAKVTITGTGNYQGTRTISVKTGIDISTATIIIDPVEYSGSELKPMPAVNLNGTSLSLGTDFTVTYKNNVNAKGADEAAAPTASITGTGAYAGTVSKRFTINQVDMSTALGEDRITHNLLRSYSYVKGGVEPEVQLYFGDILLKKSTEEDENDYSIQYIGDKNSITTDTSNKIEITGQGNYKGKITWPYEIQACDITDKDSKVKFAMTDSYVYTGEEIRPNVKVTQIVGTEEVELEEGDLEEGDFYLEYGINKKVGEDADNYVKVHGGGNYTGEYTIYFEITERSLQNVKVELIEAKEYTGQAIELSDTDLVVTDGDEKLKRGTDYTVTYVGDHTNRGIASIRINGIGNYSGTLESYYFKIQKSLSDSSIRMEDIPPQEYTGSVIVPEVKIYDTSVKNEDGTEYRLIANEDYTIEATDTECGTAEITIHGIGLYKGSITAEFTIAAYSIADENVSISITDKLNNVYTGNRITPTIEVKYGNTVLKKDVDYTYEAYNNRECGENSYVIVRGKGNFSGTSAPIYFDILPVPLDDSRISVQPIPDQNYTGADIKPILWISDSKRPNQNQILYSGIDYKVTYENNREVGTASVKIEGINNYTGFLEIEFKIKALNIEEANMNVVLNVSYTYDGTEKKPEPIVQVNNKTLKQGERDASGKIVNGDYVLDYSNNINAGEAQCKITFSANYMGKSSTRSFMIRQKSIEDSDIVIADIENQAYTGAAIWPKADVTYTTASGKLKLVENTDYMLTYGDNTEMGDNTGEVIIAGHNNYTGTVTKQFSIKKDINARSVSATISPASYVFTGRGIEPEPVVEADGKRLEENVDYKLSYLNNVNANTQSSIPTVVITGMGDYGGTKTVGFHITKAILPSTVADIIASPYWNISIPEIEFCGMSTVTPKVVIEYKPEGGEVTYTAKNTDITVGTVSGIQTGRKQFNITMKAGSSNIFVGEQGITNTMTAEVDVVARNLNQPNDLIYVEKIDDVRYDSITGEFKLPVQIIDKQRNASGVYQSNTESGSYYHLTDADYEVSIPNPVKPGTAKATITGKGNYTGSLTKEFYITGALTAENVKVEDAEYTGYPLNPKVTVTYEGAVLEADKDYSVTLDGTIDVAGTHHVRITGLGAFAESEPFDVAYKAVGKNLFSPDITINGIRASYTYDGTVKKPVPEMFFNGVLLTEDTDYELVYSNAESKDAGVYTLTVRGIRNFRGEQTYTYSIGSNFTERTVNVAIANNNASFTGEEIVPEITVTDRNSGQILVRDRDYILQMDEKNIDAGTRSIYLSGTGAYAGDLTRTFTILPASLSSVSFSEIQDVTYTGKAIEAKPESVKTGNYELVYGQDYTCRYSANINVGTVYVTITPGTSGNFSGQGTARYNIIQKNLEDSDITIADIEEQNLSSGVSRPVPHVQWNQIDSPEPVTIADTEGYTVSYSNNDKLGQATVTVTGTKNFKGSISKEFTIGLYHLMDLDIQPVKSQYYFTGSEIKPAVSVVTKEGVKLVNTVDYDISYLDNTAAGEGTVLVTTKGNYEPGTRAVQFRINPQNIQSPEDGAAIKVIPIPNQAYDNGNPVEPIPEILLINADGMVYKLTQEDVSLSYQSNMDKTAGIEGAEKATVTISGTRNFEGMLTKEFDIGDDIKNLVDQIELVGASDIVYDGNEHKPSVNVTEKETAGDLVEGRDYEILYDEDTSSGGTHTVTLAGIGNYGGTISKTYEVAPKDISTVDFEVQNYVYTGEEIHPEIIGNDEEANTILVENTHSTRMVNAGARSNTQVAFETDIAGFVNASEHMFNIRAVGNNYTGTIQETFTIEAVDIAQSPERIQVVGPEQNQTYDGTEQRPAIQIYDQKRNTLGQVIEEGSQEYYPLKEEMDYTVSVEDNIYPGMATMHIEGMGNYSSEIDRTFSIVADLADAYIAPIPEQMYIGSSIRPSVEVSFGNWTLTEGLDYKIEPVPEGENTYPGTGAGRVTITALNQYLTGTNSATFDITNNLAAATLEIETEPSNYTFVYYTGNPLTIDNHISVKYNGRVLDREAYHLIYSNNVEVGTASVYAVAATDEYQGQTQPVNFNIVKRSLAGSSAQMSVNLPNATAEFTGQAITPSVTLRYGDTVLTQGTEYTLSYENNVNPGTATVIATATADAIYTGSIRAAFTIYQAPAVDLSNSEIALVQNTFTYTGEEIRPLPGVRLNNTTLTAGTDYIVGYMSNVNAGTATVVITGIGAYQGTAATTFNIIRKSIVGCRFEVSGTAKYTGSSTTVDITVTDGNRRLVQGSDYNVSYINNINPGAATVQIVGAGNYAGIKISRYMIEVPAMGKVSAKASTTSTKLSWSKLKGVTGYEIYDNSNKKVATTSGSSYTIKKLKSMKTYKYKVRPYVTKNGVTSFGKFSKTISTVTLPAKPSIKVKAGTKKVTISWKKISGVTGYQIYRSTRKNGTYKKVKTISKSSTVKYTNSKLKAKTRYYYKVRAYKKIGGKTYYSSYSSIKNTKTK